MFLQRSELCDFIFKSFPLNEFVIVRVALSHLLFNMDWLTSLELPFPWNEFTLQLAFYLVFKLAIDTPAKESPENLRHTTSQLPPNATFQTTDPKRFITGRAPSLHSKPATHHRHVNQP